MTVLKVSGIIDPNFNVMKMIFAFLLITTYLSLTNLSYGQYDVGIQDAALAVKKINDAEKDKIVIREDFGKCKFVPTLNYKVGDRFIFEKLDWGMDDETSEFSDYFLAKDLPKVKLTSTRAELKELRKEYLKGQNTKTKILQKDYAGKIIKIIKIEDIVGEFIEESYFTFEIESTGEQIMTKMKYNRKFQKDANDIQMDKSNQLYTLPSVIYLKEIDDFREYFIGKSFYTKYLSLGRKFQPVKIIKAGAGYDTAPIRVVFENIRGEQDYKDLCTCCTNVSYYFISSSYFENFFSEENPKNLFNGKEDEWDLITQSKINIGMSEASLLLSWGQPEKINETLVSGTLSKQYVYKDQYVYLENGIITTLQSSTK